MAPDLPVTALTMYRPGEREEPSSVIRIGVLPASVPLCNVVTRRPSASKTSTLTDEASRSVSVKLVSVRKGWGVGNESSSCVAAGTSMSVTTTMSYNWTWSRRWHEHGLKDTLAW